MPRSFDSLKSLAGVSACIVFVAASTPLTIEAAILSADFNVNEDGFSYIDDAFRNTSRPGYASGTYLATGGFTGGALQLDLGGIDDTDILNMSGGWQQSFTLSVPSDITLSLRYMLTQTPDYESDEISEVLLSIDGTLIGVQSADYVARITGNGNGGGSVTTGWQLFQATTATLAAGQHVLAIGGFNNKKTLANESTEIVIDDVLLTDEPVPDPAIGAIAAVASLDFQRFKDNIQTLAAFGDRTQGSQSYANAEAWLEQQLVTAGYVIEKHPYTYQGQQRESTYVTRIGSQYPDQMYIISAHFDGRGGGGAADDDGSGSSLVLEAARVMAQPEFETERSIRFIFWNNEETGLNGSTAYVNDRASLQGIENPVGSGIYPEPTWLGIVQHDMILFDHGLPPQANQIPQADIDVEYQASSTFASSSLALANILLTGNGTHSTDYPAEIGSNMNNTDSRPFWNHTAAISVRENQRIAEIGNGSNPNWHQTTDVYSTYSEADFLLGFNALQMTLGTIAELAGTTVDSDGDGLADSLELLIGTDPDNTDSDTDGLSDGFEVGYDGDLSGYNPVTDLNPLSPDTDSDGYTDAEEISYTSDPLDSGSTPVITPDGDVNKDGSVNVIDVLLAQRHVFGLTTLLQTQVDHGDLYPAAGGNGLITLSDLLLITKAALN